MGVLQAQYLQPKLKIMFGLYILLIIGRNLKVNRLFQAAVELCGLANDTRQN